MLCHLLCALCCCAAVFAVASMAKFNISVYVIAYIKRVVCKPVNKVILLYARNYPNNNYKNRQLNL